MSERTFSLKNYPLCWPDDWKRTSSYQRNHGRFKHFDQRANVNLGITRVLNELEKLGIKRDDILISTNRPTRMDGMPRGDGGEPGDPGVAVYWRKKQDAPMQCIAIDIYHTVADNLCAVAATLEAMRAIERHGGAQVQERAYRGFTALPAQASTKRPWREVFGIAGSGNITREILDAQYRSLARVRHPDAGGSDAAMAELNVAREEALKEVR